MERGLRPLNTERTLDERPAPAPHRYVENTNTIISSGAEAPKRIKYSLIKLYGYARSFTLKTKQTQMSTSRATLNWLLEQQRKRTDFSTQTIYGHGGAMIGGLGIMGIVV
ncbi:hypothetical protein NDU88_006633 [Pleurodeles waltl]|uniref:Uncharacterized protein n=1 Tax=Pleurodeles waltl TaxID=8319 RepID=A0AAV7LR89_PLEWA|nr:hypothetical protein NDU88_006633 [Pleurodeles waltl]